ncbi:MAG: helicase-related protein, partial [Bacteroidota bacterium]
TSFLPEADVKAFSNNARPGDGNSDVLTLNNLSIWSTWGNNDYLANLKSFAEAYKNWTDNTQWEKIKDEAPVQNAIGLSLITKQKNTYNRLIRNIQYLQTNEEALLCFKLANTAMLIQMVVARDSRFEKNRDIDSVNGNTYKDINFFKCYAANNVEKQPSYRPFQLAFLLMNVESTFNQESEDRTNIVDLIWFPTGGGKTEAYLALTALTILKRRIENVDDNTTAVIMRYTLRLLTSQQFERATYLICALEFLRENVAGLNVKDLSLGNEKLSIGMWVGSTTSPNNIHDLKANSYYNDFFEEPTEEKNRFPITYCPWCGVKLTLPSGEKNDYGYVLTKNALTLICQNNNCFFHGQDDRVLPVAFIDEQLYNAPPTLLFATVDKMVQLSHKDEPGKFFDQQLPPELIIQDELHLLTGPLGSMTGLYETLIQILCTTDKYKPKIVASTATTRNTHKIIRMMYGRELNIFPPQGVRYNDNYFSFVEKESKRKHIGLVPAGKSSVTTEIKLVEAIYLAKARLLQEYLGEHDIEYLAANEQKGALKNQVDPFWTLVLYYNSLRDLGRSNSRVSQEFKEYIRGKYTSFGLNDTFEFIHGNIFSRSVEFTSRQDSGKIKGLLSRMEKSISFNANDGKIFEDNDCIDLALASNMFSVGIDVDRLNLMMVMGQPNSVSEYIQATSRVARKSKGLVVNMYSTMRTREMSFYENFTGFHNTYYKNVEPLSITPYTEVAVDKLLNALLVGFVRQKLNKKPQAFSADDAVSFYHEIADRIPDPIQKNYIRSKLDTLANSWIQLKGAGFNYTTLLKNPDFILMNSLRDIDPDLFMKNSDLDYTPNYQ